MSSNRRPIIVSSLLSVTLLAGVASLANVVVISRAVAAEADEASGRLETIERRAKQGDAVAQLNLGNAYAYGHYDLAKDPTKAMDWWRKAADQNQPDAQLYLGTFYLRGEGVQKDPKKPPNGIARRLSMAWIRRSSCSVDFMPSVEVSTLT